MAYTVATYAAKLCLLTDEVVWYVCADGNVSYFYNYKLQIQIKMIHVIHQEYQKSSATTSTLIPLTFTWRYHTRNDACVVSALMLHNVHSICYELNLTLSISE